MGLQLGIRFEKSERLSTEADGTLQVLEMTRLFLGPPKVKDTLEWWFLNPDPE